MGMEGVSYQEYQTRCGRAFSILPFEVDFFEGSIIILFTMWVTLHWTKWRLTKGKRKKTSDVLRKTTDWRGKPVLALLAGSRKQEIKDNLPMMVEAASVYEGQYEVGVGGSS